MNEEQTIGYFKLLFGSLLPSGLKKNEVKLNEFLKSSFYAGYIFGFSKIDFLRYKRELIIPSYSDLSDELLKSIYLEKLSSDEEVEILMACGSILEKFQSMRSNEAREFIINEQKIFNDNFIRGDHLGMEENLKWFESLNKANSYHLGENLEILFNEFSKALDN
jgi:hypothetical protein